MTDEEKLEEEIFKNVYLPKSLDQVIDFERDLEQLKLGAKSENDIHYRTLLGLSKDLTSLETEPNLLAGDASESGGDISEEEKDTSDEEHEKSRGVRVTVGNRDMSPNSRKEAKKAVKIAQAEKRTTKIKKHVKKRAEKLNKKK